MPKETLDYKTFKAWRNKISSSKIADLTENARYVFEEMYIDNLEDGRRETVEERLAAISIDIASADFDYALPEKHVLEFAEKLYDLQVQNKLRFNTPTTMNFGRWRRNKGGKAKQKKQMGSACFVLPIDDSFGESADNLEDGILNAWVIQQHIHRAGGGTGFSFARLRPKGSIIGYEPEIDGEKSIDWSFRKGITSGYISFLEYMFDPATSAVKQGHCLVPETLVFTKKGLLRLDEMADIKNSGFKKHKIYVHTDKGLRLSRESFNNGVTKTVEVITKDGMNIKGTKNHKVKIFRDNEIIWETLGNLKKGDLLYTKLGKYSGRKLRLKIPDTKNIHFNQKKCKLPKYIDEKFSFFLGLYYGDGFFSLNDYRIGITCHIDSYLINYLPELIKELFDLKPTIYKKENENALTFVISNKQLHDFLILNDLIKPKSNINEIPKTIRTIPTNSICMFLRGLFEADGSVTSNYPTLATASHTFAIQISIILKGLGIPNSIRKTNRRQKNKNNLIKTEGNLYIIRIKSFVGLEKYIKKIGFDEKSRFSKLDTKNVDLSREKVFHIYNYKNIINPVLKYITKKQTRGKNVNFRSSNPNLRKCLLRYLRKERFFSMSSYIYLTNKYVDFAKNAPKIDTTDYFDEVIIIREGGNILTLDLSVDENNTYIANGIVSHNTRRGANMGVQRIDHPDFLDHVYAKFGNSKFDLEYKIRNFNLSIAMTDEFMEAVEKGHHYTLINPHRTKKLGKKSVMHISDLCPQKRFEELLVENERNPFSPATLPSLYLHENGRDVVNAYSGTVLGFVDDGIVKIDARKVLETISELTWTNGEPGVIFIDRINEYNPDIANFEIEGVNPCAEECLAPFEACNLASINIAKYIVEGELNKSSLATDIGLVVRALDNIIDRNDFPSGKITDAVRKTRKIGLGYMGIADALILSGVRYGSAQSFEKASEWAKLLSDTAREVSNSLAVEKGEYPLWETSLYNLETEVSRSFLKTKRKMKYEYDRNTRGLRNSYQTTQAPTGTISRTVGCSSGIEPVFGLVYSSNILGGKICEMSYGFKKVLEDLNLITDKELLEAIESNGGTLEINDKTPENTRKQICKIPEEKRKFLVTARELSVEEHIEIQGRFQDYTDSSISKTVNLSRESTVDDVLRTYMIAWKRGLKGVALYRDGSRGFQVLEARREGVEENGKEYQRPLAQFGFTIELPIADLVANGNDMVNYKPPRIFTTLAYDPLTHKVNSIFQNLSVRNQHLNDLVNMYNMEISHALKTGDSKKELERLISKHESYQSSMGRGVITEDGTHRTQVANDSLINATLKSLYFVRFVSNDFEDFSVDGVQERYMFYRTGKVTMKEIVDSHVKGRIKINEDEGNPSILRKKKTLKLPSDMPTGYCPSCG